MLSQRIEVDIASQGETPELAIGSRPRIIFDSPSIPQTKISSTPGYTHPYYWAPFVLIGNSQ